MIVDNLTAMETYVETQSLLKIIGNTTTNSNGLLEKDSNNNELITVIDSGDTPLYRLAVYTGIDGLMLYNPTTKNIQIAKEGDFLNVAVDFTRGTKYYIGAKLIKSTSVNVLNGSFEVPLNGLNVFKIFMDGRELKSYSINNNTISIYGNDRRLLDNFSELIIYAYQTTVIDNDSIMFEIEYYQYEVIWDKDLFFDSDYLESIKGININCFESMSINQSVTKTLYRGGFKRSTKSRINSIDNTVDLNIFSGLGFIDMLQYVGTNEFRMIFINPASGRCILLNNCRNDNGVSLILEKSKNTKKFNLSCGNYIDMQHSEPSIYSNGRYSKGLYSSDMWVYNSHKKGD